MFKRLLIFMRMLIKYHRYLIRHRWYVFVECVKFGIPLRGLVHDISKYFPDEFFPYMKYFYGDKKEKKAAQDSFNFAWLKHQKRNKHHWQWWMLRLDSGGTVTFELPKDYCYEMLADWIGAGKAIYGKLYSYSDTLTWYSNNKEKIVVDPYTRLAFEKILEELAYAQQGASVKRVKIESKGLSEIP